MTSTKILFACLCVMTALILSGCKNTAESVATTSPGDAGVTDVEKVKPAPGTGNVQGKVLYNNQPVENIEVRLCEQFSRFVGGCGGRIFTARTDREGEYVITNVEPKTYEGLMARVFDTDSYVFATAGIGGISSAKYEVTADKTLFISPTHLFKSDLRLISPKAAAKLGAKDLELSWEAYPDAAYYKFSVHPEDTSLSSPYINERTDATSFTIDKPMQGGTYRWQVHAFNDQDRKLAESSQDFKFTIIDTVGP